MFNLRHNGFKSSVKLEAIALMSFSSISRFEFKHFFKWESKGPFTTESLGTVWGFEFWGLEWLLPWILTPITTVPAFSIYVKLTGFVFTLAPSSSGISSEN